MVILPARGWVAGDRRPAMSPCIFDVWCGDLRLRFEVDLALFEFGDEPGQNRPGFVPSRSSLQTTSVSPHLRPFTASLLSRSLSQRSKQFKEAECRLPAS